MFGIGRARKTAAAEEERGGGGPFGGDSGPCERERLETKRKLDRTGGNRGSSLLESCRRFGAGEAEGGVVVDCVLG